VALLALALGCGSTAATPDGAADGSGPVDGPNVPDAAPDVGGDLSAAPDRPGDGASDGAPDLAADGSPGGDVSPADAAADLADAPADTAPADTASPDTAPACSPAPDQRGFYASCSACPNPGDCDTIDVNGNRRYACGCSSPCPCGLRCGSYVIPGTGISIGSICVR